MRDVIKEVKTEGGLVDLSEVNRRVRIKSKDEQEKELDRQVE